MPVSTTQTGPGLSGSSRTNSDNRGSDYRDSGNCESGITASGNRDRDNYRGSDNSQGQSHAGLMSYMPGTQACKGAHRDDGANYGGNQDRNNYNNRGRSDNYVGRDEYGLDRNNCDGRDISAGQLQSHTHLHVFLQIWFKGSLCVIQICWSAYLDCVACRIAACLVEMLVTGPVIFVCLAGPPAANRAMAITHAFDSFCYMSSILVQHAANIDMCQTCKSLQDLLTVSRWSCIVCLTMIPTVSLLIVQFCLCTD